MAGGLGNSFPTFIQALDALIMSVLFRRLAIGLLVLLALIGVAGFVFARFWLDDYLKEQIIGITDRGSHQLYTLQMEKLHVNIFTGSAEATGVQLQTDSLRWENMHQEKPDSTPLKIDLKVNTIAIRYFNWGAYWRNKELNVNGIEFIEPQLKLTSVKDSLLKKDPKTDTLSQSMLDRLPQLLAARTPSLSIGSVVIRNGKITYSTKQPRGTTYLQADSIDCFLSGINIVPGDTMQTSKALYANNISLTLHNCELYPAGSVYGYRIKSATIGGQDELVQMEEVSILPKVSDVEFMQRLTIRKPRLKLKASEVVIRKLNLFRALHRQEWTMESLAVEHANINIFQNKNLPPKLNKKMPNELFRDLKGYLNIDTVIMRNAHLLYTEVIEDGKGLLEFDHINGVVLNITNDTLKMSAATPALIYARAELMGAGVLDVSLKMPLLTRTFECSYVANLGKMNMVYLNRLLTDKDHLRVDSGESENIIAKVNIKGNVAQGSVEATYGDLKLSLLREEDNSKKKLLSAVANLLIRGKNDREETSRPFKIGTVEYTREPADGFIRYLWRAAQTGLMATLLPVKVKLGKKRD